MTDAVGGGDRAEDVSLLDVSFRVGSFDRALDRDRCRNVPSEVFKGSDLGGRLRVTHHRQLSIAHLLTCRSSGIHRLVVQDLAVRVKVSGDELREVEARRGVSRFGHRHHAQLPLPRLRGRVVRAGLRLVLLDRFPRRRVGSLDLKHRDALVGSQHVKGRARAVDHEGDGDPEEDRHHRERGEDRRDESPVDDGDTPGRVVLLQGHQLDVLRGHLRIIHRVIVSHPLPLRTRAARHRFSSQRFCRRLSAHANKGRLV